MYRIQIHQHGNIIDEFYLECAPARLVWCLTKELLAKHREAAVGRRPQRPYIVGDVFSITLDGVPAAAALVAVAPVVTGE